MKTTVDGTNYVGLVANSLMKHLKVAYKSVYITGSDATKAEREQFWKDLVLSIDSGYGVAMNWEAPPTNYPRGVNGSKSPSYGGGTVFHYVSAMGYEERDGQRYVFVVDSGFQPRSYWVTLEQAASLIAGKGYAFASGGSLDAAAVNAYKRGFEAPIASDVNDLRSQVTGVWPQLGNRTLRDAIAAIMEAVA